MVGLIFLLSHNEETDSEVTYTHTDTQSTYRNYKQTSLDTASQMAFAN